MIVFFCALVVYNNMAAFGLMLERIHENSENTLVLYQKSLDENLSRPETYLYVFALNDADLLSLRAAEPQTTSWYVTLNRIKKSFENAAPNYTVDGFFCYRSLRPDQQPATAPLELYPRNRQYRGSVLCMESQRNQREILPCPYPEPERISARRVHFHGYTPRHSGRYKNAGQPSVFFRWFSSSAHPVKRCPPGGSPLEMATVSFLRNRRNLLDGGFT